MYNQYFEGSSALPQYLPDKCSMHSSLCLHHLVEPSSMILQFYTPMMNNCIISLFKYIATVVTISTKTQTLKYRFSILKILHTVVKWNVRSCSIPYFSSHLYHSRPKSLWKIHICTYYSGVTGHLSWTYTIHICYQPVNGIALLIWYTGQNLGNLCRPL